MDANEHPIESDDRRLGNLDLAVLWGDLAVGLLVLAAGALLVPGMGLAAAAGAIVVGSAVGVVPLALVGWAGAREGLPGMRLFRPVLGARGSWIPTVFNVVQLLGWTALEIWAMARVASVVSREAVGVELFPLWLLVVTVGCTALALGGPVRVVRVWLERFGVWVVGACGLWITWRLAGAIGDAWGVPGVGGWPTFPLAVDLVIAMCVSWLPLVADYNRFARGRGVAGTAVGFGLGNAWFLFLGAALAATGVGPDAVGIGAAVADLGGGLVVLALLVAAESDEAFANIYSAAVSLRNLVPRVPHRAAVIGIASVAAVLAATLSMADYQSFLLLIGSVFVPLFGVFLAAYFLRGRRGEARPGLDVGALAAWVLGFLAFQWSAPTGPGWWVDAAEGLAAWLHLPMPLWDGGASLPGFAMAFVAALALVRRRGAAPRPPAPPTDRQTRSSA